MTTFTPTTSNRSPFDAVRWAVAEANSRWKSSDMGRSAASAGRQQTEHAVDLSRLTGITLYEPAELVLSARAGHAACRDREAMLAEQRPANLAFEPMDYTRLLGGGREEGPGKAGTIGGVLAANLCRDRGA
jgi:glycolate oxidase FAD binding subunit